MSTLSRVLQRSAADLRDLSLATLFLVLVLQTAGRAQSLDDVHSDNHRPRDAARILALESTVVELQRQLADLQANSVTSGGSWADLGLPRVETASAADGSFLAAPSISHFTTYDDAWTLRPYDAARTPFELRFNLHNQFRYTGFHNGVDQFEDSAGRVHPIPARNDFDINRGRFVISGYAFDPKFEFYTNIDYNTVAKEPVLLLLSWMSYKFSDSFILRMGLGKIPGTWEWDESSRFTMGAERSMATTFFRPSITAGVWAEGEISEGLFYHAMVGDGFNTFTLRAAELDQNLVYSGLLWWEPLGDYGRGFSDLENHQELALRMGHGFTFSANDADPLGEPGPEQTLIRLSDGTRLVEPGALAPNASVNQFDISLYSAHLGIKRGGFSISAEYMFRWLTSLEGTGPLPVRSLFDHGFFASAGAFVIPQRLELYGLGSQVDGEFGNGTEVGGGVNWYAGGRRGNRFTCEYVKVDDSPAQQDRTGLLAGASGVLIRAQWWHFF